MIARNSSFTYKGKAVDTRRVGPRTRCALCPRGGVRKSGSRVRITTQLIDAESGKRLWPNATIATWSTSSRSRTRSPRRLWPRSSPSCWRPNARCTKVVSYLSDVLCQALRACVPKLPTWQQDLGALSSLLGAAGTPRQLRPFRNGQRYVVFVPRRAKHDRSHLVRPICRDEQWAA
jgi:hypothetical protein